MTTLLDTLRSNPRIATEVESIIRWSSFLVATRKSPFLGELLSSGANLLQLCNDLILRQSNPQLRLDLSNVATQLKTFLSVLQSLELLAEIYARDTYGSVGKWAIITVIQITKAAIKLILLFVFDQGLTKSQSQVPLDRVHYSEIIKLQEKFSKLDTNDSGLDLLLEDEQPLASTSKTVLLKSSGRKMRSITDAPPKESRFSDDSSTKDTFAPFNRLQKQRLVMLLHRYREHRAATLTERQIYGEVLHISRPLVHLALMGTFGTKSWLSWLTSFVMDVSSLYLVDSSELESAARATSGIMSRAQVDPQYHKFNINEILEIRQRYSSFILYLLRSPFFDEYTKQRALEGIATTADGIPLIGHYLSTFISYIPDWQKDYFRVWSE